MKRLVLVASIATLLLLPCTAFALDFTFDDSVIYWNNWISSNSDGTYINDNVNDTIGYPDLIGGEGTITAGNLTSINIFYNDYDPAVAAGDLFIDVGANSYWDYVLTAEGFIYRFADNTFSAFKDVNNADNNKLYEITTDWLDKGYLIRNDHPYALNVEALNSSIPFTDLGTYSFSGFVNGDDSVNFYGFSLPVGDKAFILGFGPNCANDVIYEKVAPVPEPGTILLVGSGLIGLAGFRRKFKIS
jgi:hypothetical protein